MRLGRVHMVVRQRIGRHSCSEHVSKPRIGIAYDGEIEFPPDVYPGHLKAIERLNLRTQKALDMEWRFNGSPSANDAGRAPPKGTSAAADVLLQPFAACNIIHRTMNECPHT